jgi:L-lactate utilization protein LutB
MLNQVKEALEKRDYTVHLFETAQEAKEYLLGAISPNQSVGFGGSMTLKELGLDQALMEQGNTVYWHWTAEDKEAAQRQANLADVYLTSANALTKSGQIINVDGHGNRVACSLYGHEKVYFVFGLNKIAPTLEAAVWRARNIAAPINARRLGYKTPCAVKGDRCYDCNSADRICNAMVLHLHKLSRCQVEVVLIGQELGF